MAATRVDRQFEGCAVVGIVQGELLDQEQESGSQREHRRGGAAIWRSAIRPPPELAFQRRSPNTSWQDDTGNCDTISVRGATVPIFEHLQQGQPRQCVQCPRHAVQAHLVELVEGVAWLVIVAVADEPWVYPSLITRPDPVVRTSTRAGEPR